MEVFESTLLVARAQRCSPKKHFFVKSCFGRRNPALTSFLLIKLGVAELC